MKKAYNTPDINIVTIGNLMLHEKDMDGTMLRASRFSYESGKQNFIKDDDSTDPYIDIPAPKVNLWDDDTDW